MAHQVLNANASSGYSYNVCIKKQDGFCCVQYQVCADQTGAFTLDATINPAKAMVDGACTSAIDFVRIPGELAV
jgi:hypothetical protein